MKKNTNPWMVLNDQGLHLIEKDTGKPALWDDEKVAKADVAAHYGAKRMPNGFKAVRVTDEQLAEFNAPAEPEATEDEPAEHDSAEQFDTADDDWEQAPMVPAVIEPEAAIAKANGNVGALFDLANDFDKLGYNLFIESSEAKWAMGTALNKAKAATLATGKLADWTTAMQANFHGSQPTASRWMRIADEYSTLNGFTAALDAHAGKVGDVIKAISAKSGKAPRGKKAQPKKNPQDESASAEWSLTIIAGEPPTYMLLIGGVDSEPEALTPEQNQAVYDALHEAQVTLSTAAKA